MKMTPWWLIALAIAAIPFMLGWVGCTTEVVVERTPAPVTEAPAKEPVSSGLEEAFRTLFIEGYMDGDSSLRPEAECVWETMIDGYPGGVTGLMDDVEPLSDAELDDFTVDLFLADIEGYSQCW